jgi:signal transduction histidine kinase
MDETFYITEALTRPGFFEGSLTFDALEQATKHMNDRISSYQASGADYQEYVETWIHEIKTPLVSARLIIENNQSEAISHLEDELDRIESFVEQALYYSRSTAVENDYAIRSVNLENLIKGTLRKQSKALINADIAPVLVGVDEDIYADAKWLDFILGQIVRNASQYHDPAKQKRQMVFTSNRLQQGFDSEKVILSIFDNGIGIAKSDISRVFDKGFTGETGRKFAKSTGIGLYLCKKLCDKMKLTLSIESIPGKGTTVTIEFPANKMYFLD